MTIRGFEQRTEATAEQPVRLDEGQRAVLALGDSESAAVLGAPGTGKTTTIVEAVADRVLGRGWGADELLVLTTSRGTATRLRDVLSLRLGQPTNGPVARTINSLAFEIVGHAARLAGEDAPRLVTGGDQDSDISQLLQGQLEEGTGPVWPDPLGPEVRALRGFRTELRELMMRATEYGVTPDALRALGASHEHPEWIAAAAFIDDYLDVVSTSRHGQLDSAELVQFAVAAIDSGELGERASRLRLLLVDDLQEATKSTLALLAAFARRGVAVVAFGDPDVAVNAFRGGEPDAIGRLGAVLGVPALRTLVLSTAHRQSPALRAVTSRIVERIGVAGAFAQRKAVASVSDAVEESGPAVLVVQAASVGRQWSSIARILRERHLMDGIPWNRMAVVLRGGGQVPAAARALALAEVPTRTAVGGKALREDTAARSLLTIVDVGTGRTALSAELATELLLGPSGGLDRLGLRRLRLALRAEELAGGGNRSGDELLVDALSAPGRFATIDHRTGRHADSLARTLAEVGERATDGGTIEELLWHVWERSGLGPVWFENAIGSGIVATEANRHLDGVVALFTAAKRFVEREPGRPASDFLEAVLDAEVPEDTLSPQSAEDSVFVTTPQGVVGLEFDVVVVAGVQEGVWPNLRLRGSLLGPQALVNVVTRVDDSTVDARKQVLGDELRMFAMATSRARRQLVIAAVANEDEAPSVFFSLLPDGAVATDVSTHAPLSLRGLTGRLRKELVSGRRGEAEKSAAASALARLALERVPGADPADWHGLLEPSTQLPLFDEEQQVPVSPSQLDKFEQSPLDWFVEAISGGQSSTAMGIGTIVHWAMETATDPSVDAVWASIEGRWKELLFEAPWIGEQQKAAARILAAGVAEYLADFAREGKALVGAESRFTLEVGRAEVRGSIDRVERSADGAVVIVDLKTGNPITRQDDIDVHPQLGAYQLAYAEGVLDEVLEELGEHRSGGAKLLFVKKGVRAKAYREGAQAPLTAEQLEAFRERIRQAAAGMAAASYSGTIELSEWGGNTAERRLHRTRAVSSD